MGFSLWWFLLLQSTGSRHTASGVAGTLENVLSSCGTRLSAAQHGASSWTRGQTCVPCMSKCNPIHCTTREVLENFYMKASCSKSHHQLTSVICLLRGKSWQLRSLRIYYQVWTQGRENCLIAINLSLVKTHTQNPNKLILYSICQFCFMSFKTCQYFGLKCSGLWL